MQPTILVLPPEIITDIAIRLEKYCYFVGRGQFKKRHEVAYNTYPKLEFWAVVVDKKTSLTHSLQ